MLLTEMWLWDYQSGQTRCENKCNLMRAITSHLIIYQVFSIGLGAVKGKYFLMAAETN